MTYIPAQATVNNVDSKDIEPGVIDLSNAGDGTTTLIFDVRTFRTMGFQYFVSGGSGTKTLTIEASMEDVASGSANFDDVTSALTGSATFTADTIEIFDIKPIYRWLKFKVVISGASSDANVDLIPRIGW